VSPRMNKTMIILPNNVYNKNFIFLPQNNNVATTKAMDTKIGLIFFMFVYIYTFDFISAGLVNLLS
jgi:uncharacterized protein with PQ loop repeat